MARKDEILMSFLKHEKLQEAYQVKESELPKTVREALKSEVPIIKTMALIVENLESTTPITDAGLRNIVTQFLNEAAI